MEDNQKKLADINSNDWIPLIYRVLHDCFKDWTEDDFQNGYFGLVKAIKYYQPNKGRKFSTFAYMCIKQIILHERLKEQTQTKHIAVHLDQKINEDTTIYTLIPSDDDTEKKAIVNIESYKIKEALSELTSNQQYLINAYFYKELSYSKIAKEKGISVNAAHSSMKYALKKMKKNLQ